MHVSLRSWVSRKWAGWLVLLSLGPWSAGAVHAQSLVPGTGQKIDIVGDDFEDKEWTYNFNGPKSSTNLDKDERLPGGESANNRIYESTYRGQPDVIRRVPTPPGGIPGSRGSLLMQSKHTGIPGAPSFKMQQDDLLVNVSSRLGGFVPVSWNPSVVTRVYLPDWAEWEPRTGSTFAFRAETQATFIKDSKGWSRRSLPSNEPYWPGIFIQYNCKKQGAPRDSATLLIRADQEGHEIIGPEITQLGWWTLGMSFTPDGRIHYYAKPGVEPLTHKDHLVSTYPYGVRCERLNTFFFNVVNIDDGRTWSTPWVIDDPALHYIKPYGATIGTATNQTPFQPSNTPRSSFGNFFRR